MGFNSGLKVLKRFVRVIEKEMQIDQVRSFSYLGKIVNGKNTLEEQIREGIFKGNKAFYVNKTFF
jgi:glutaredoxin-related protein